MMENFLCVLLGLSVINKIQASDAWGYHSKGGPAHWKDNYPVCSLHRQSPINIDTNVVVHKTSLKPIMLTGYDVTGFATTISNNGHTAVTALAGNGLISGGPLAGKYKAAQLHFHWGSDVTKGSEHTVDGKRFPLEMHIVHFATKYGTIQEAMNKTDGLAVLGVLFQVDTRENTDLDWIIDNFNKIVYRGRKTPVASSTFVRKMVPQNLDTYITYQGSLTTPPCFESVTWIIFPEPIGISKSQLSSFRSLNENSDHESDHGQMSLQNNYRPTQPLGSRTVYASYTLNAGACLQAKLTFLFMFISCLFLITNF